MIMAVAAIKLSLGLNLGAINFMRRSIDTAHGIRKKTPFTLDCIPLSVTSFEKNRHKAGTTLWIIWDTVDRLTSKSKAKLSIHGYFLSHRKVNSTLFVLFSFAPCLLRRIPPLQFNLFNTGVNLKTMSSSVSWSSPVFSQNKCLSFSTEVKTYLPLKSKPRKRGSKRCIIGRMMFRLGGGITAASSIIYASNIRKAYLNRFCRITCGGTTVHKKFKSKQAAMRAGRRPCLGIVHDCSNEPNTPSTDS